MARKADLQGDLFGAPPALFEYYPVLLPDEAGMRAITSLYEMLVQVVGLRPSQLVKLPHISLDGIICPERDDEVITGIRSFLSTQDPIHIEFTEVGYFRGQGGVTLKLGLLNSDRVLEFNRLFMTATGGKITKLNLHLTIARYVNPELLERLQQSDIIYPQTCICGSVALLKKRVKEKGAYANIGTLEFKA